MENDTSINAPNKDNFYNRPAPEKSKTYNFYDDGKCGLSRHYYATVEEVIPKDEIKKDNKDIFKLWEKLKKQESWIFAEDTDYFVRAEMHFYLGVGSMWFAREQDGGWFSIDDSWIGGGSLDVDEKMTNSILEWYPDYLKYAEKKAIETLLDRIHNKYYEDVCKWTQPNINEKGDE